MKKVFLSLVLLGSLLFGGSVYGVDNCEFEEIDKIKVTELEKGLDKELIEQLESDYKNNIIKYKESIYIENKEGKYYVINNGIKGEGYEYIVDLLYSFDGKKNAYIVRENNKGFVIYDGKRSKDYDKISSSHLKFGLNGSFTFIGVKENKPVLVKDLNELDSFDGVFSPRYSLNGEKFGYIAIKDGSQFVIMNDKESKKYDKVRVYNILNDDIIYEIRYNNDSLDNEEKFFHFVCDNINNILKTKKELTFQLIKSKINLEKDEKMVKYIEKFDSLIPKISKDKLDVIYEKLLELSEKVIENKKYKYILDYLEAKVGLEILEREESNN